MIANPITLTLAVVLLITSPAQAQVETQAPYFEFYQRYQQAFSEHHAHTEHWIDSGPYQLHAREFGSKTNEPSLILLHGFPDNQHLYDRILPLLADEHHVISFDFLGWGRSDTPADFHYSIAQQTMDLDNVINYFGLSSVLLVVHDMSGPPAIDWALENNAKTAGLVLLDTYYGPMQNLIPPEAIAYYATPRPDRQAIIDLALQNDAIWLAGLEQQLEKFFVKTRIRDTYTKIFAHLSLAIRPAFFDLTATLYQDVGNNAVKQATQLKDFQKPVSIIFGKEDPYLNPGVAREFHALFPNSQLHLIKNAGHFVQLDKPKAVAKQIGNFMEQFHEREDKTEMDDSREHHE